MQQNLMWKVITTWTDGSALTSLFDNKERAVEYTSLIKKADELVTTSIIKNKVWIKEETI